MVFRGRKKDFRGKALNILGERREYLPERKFFMKIADAHSDTLYAIALEGIAPAQAMASPENLKKGGMSLQTFALFTGRKGPAGTPYQDALKMIEASKSLSIPMLTGDLPDALPDAPTGIFSIEGGEALEGKLERLEEFDRLCRVRMIALTWNHENEIGHPAKFGTEGGLKPFGLKLLAEMDRLGIYADASHLNEAGFWDIVEHMVLPPIASHSCCRELCDTPRNLYKAQAEAIIQKNGFIGVNFYPHFLTKAEKATVEDVVRHIDRFCELGGEHIVGFGSDFDGIEVQPEGLACAADFPNLIEALLKHGYTDAQVRGFAGENLFSALKRAERARRV